MTKYTPAALLRCKFDAPQPAAGYLTYKRFESPQIPTRHLYIHKMQIPCGIPARPTAMRTSVSDFLLNDIQHFPDILHAKHILHRKRKSKLTLHL